MVTIHDVAKRAGVSIATVSNVINNSNKVAKGTAERVKKAIYELNYIPNNIAKGLKMNATRTIGILAEDVSAFSSPDIIDGICEECERSDYQINLANLRVNNKVNQNSGYMYNDLAKDEGFRKSIQAGQNTLLSVRISALIYIGVHPRDVSGLLPQIYIPIVYTYCYAKNPSSSKAQNINYDDFQGAKLAVEYLIQQGHSKIAIIGGVINSYSTHRRMMGYQTALMEHSLPLHPEYITSGNWMYESGYEQMNKLLQLSDPPTAVFVMNDLMSYGAIAACKEHHISVPDDISIHGYDNHESAPFVTPPLTTIALPLHKMGVMAAKSAIDMVEHRNEDKTMDLFVQIPCRHVIRSSVR